MQKPGRDYWTCPSMKIKKSPGKIKSPFRFTDLVSMHNGTECTERDKFPKI